MIINGFVLKKPFSLKGFLNTGALTLLLLFSLTSYGQTAEAEKNFAVCKACHTIGGGKLVGPDLKGINDKYDEAWLIKFIQNSAQLIESGDPQAIKVFEENNKIPMPPNALSDDQVRDLLLYIANDGKIAGGAVAEVAEETAAESTHESAELLLAEMKRNDARNMRTTFMVLLILMLISLFDLIIIKLIKARWIHAIIILISLFVMGEIIFVEATNLGRQQYYQPEQPVWFSHKIHAGQNKIDCKYCHFNADKSMHAGIPPVQVCLNCHNQVKEGKITGATEIAKIHQAVADNKPIEWIKVHNLPDHVYFNHAQHVAVGKIDCAQCHGEVEKMDEIIQVEDRSMGWCVGCHRTTKVQFESNKFYEQYVQTHEKLKSGELDKVTALTMGGDECQKCHY